MISISETAPTPLEAVAAKFAALAHPARLSILQYLAERPTCCCRDVVAQMELAQSTVSQHLKVLVDAGLVRFEADKQRSRYAVDPGAMRVLAAEVDCLFARCCGASGS